MEIGRNVAVLLVERYAANARWGGVSMRTIMAYRYEVKDTEGKGTGRYVSLRLDRDAVGALRVAPGMGMPDLAEILDSGVMAELEAVMAEPEAAERDEEPDMDWAETAKEERA